MIQSEFRITEKILLLSIFAISTFSLGSLLLSPLIFVSVPVVAYLGLVLLQVQHPLPSVEIKRGLERQQIYEKDALGVLLHISNFGKNDIPILEVRDTVPLDFELVGSSSSFLVSLKAGESTDIQYTLRSKTFGLPKLGPINLRSLDAHGFFESVSVIQTYSTVVVLAHTSEKLEHLKIRPRRTKSWPGEIVARRIGMGMDYFSIRQFLPGDSFKSVNWRASARSVNENQFLVNQYMAELGADTMVIVDGRAIADVGTKPESAVSYSIHATIAITDRLLKDRNRVGLITLGEVGERIPPGYGKRQHGRMVLSMLRIKAGETWTIENLPRYLQFFYPNLALVFFVSSLTDESSFGAAADIARMGYDLIVVSPNPLDFGLRNDKGKKSRIWKVAKDLAEINRRMSIEQLRKIDVKVVDWRVSDPLEAAIGISLNAWNRQAGLMRIHKR